MPWAARLPSRALMRGWPVHVLMACPGGIVGSATQQSHSEPQTSSTSIRGTAGKAECSELQARFRRHLPHLPSSEDPAPPAGHPSALLLKMLFAPLDAPSSSLTSHGWDHSTCFPSPRGVIEGPSSRGLLAPGSQALSPGSCIHFWSLLSVILPTPLASLAPALPPWSPLRSQSPDVACPVTPLCLHLPPSHFLTLLDPPAPSHLTGSPSPA